MLDAIVDSRVARADDAHPGLNGLDGLAAIGHVECHIAEVGVGVGELPGGKPHVRGARVFASGTCLTREREIGFGVQRRGYASRIAVHRMLLPVIVSCGARAHDAHRRRNRLDSLVAVSHGEDHGTVVGLVRTGKLVGGEPHLRGARVCASSVRLALVTHKGRIEHELAFGAPAVHVGGNVIAVHRMLLPVIGNSTLGTGDGDLHSHGLDDLVAVGYIEGDAGEVGVVGHFEHIGGEPHLRGAGPQACGARLTRKRYVGRDVEQRLFALGQPLVHAGPRRVARNHMLEGIVIVFGACTFDLHRHGNWGYANPTVAHGENRREVVVFVDELICG